MARADDSAVRKRVPDGRLPRWLAAWLDHEPVRYLIAGGCAFLADASVLFLLTDIAGWHYLVSNVFGYAAGLIVSYTTNIKWVFRHRRFARVDVEFTIFNAILLAGLGLSELFMYLFVDHAGLHYLYAKLAVAVVIMVFNYVAKKLILFRPRGGAR